MNEKSNSPNLLSETATGQLPTVSKPVAFPFDEEQNKCEAKREHRTTETTNTKELKDMSRNARSTTKKSTKKLQPTPEQIAWNMPISVAMDAFYGTATEKDFEHKDAIYNAFAEALDRFRDDPEVNTRHFVMAALDLVRVSIIAHANA